MTYKWQEAYKAALLETDWSKMEQLIRKAESAIQDRKRELGPNGNGSREETQAIADAMNSLSVLKTECAAWSVRKSEAAS